MNQVTPMNETSGEVGTSFAVGIEMVKHTANNEQIDQNIEEMQA